MLAKHWGVTPAQWRADATPEDWATAVHLIEREHDEAERSRRG